MKGSLKRSLFVVVGLIAIAALGIFIQLGLGKKAGLGFGSGTIEILVPTKDARVFLDSKQKGFTVGDNERVVLRNISSEPHLVIVSREGHWPWAKTVEIKTKETVSLHPFYLPQLIDFVTVSPSDSRWLEAWNAVNNEKLPSEESLTLSDDSTMALWVANNKIFVEWRGSEKATPYYFCKNDFCEKRLQIFSGLSNIISADFLEKRNDVIIFSNEDGIFAIEADKNETQNFQPILRTESPKFHQTDSVLYARVGGELRVLSFE